MTTPPFPGSIEFKLAIGAFDVRVLRQARLTYAYVPGWSYYDEQAGKAPDYRHFEPASSRPTPLPRGRRST